MNTAADQWPKRHLINVDEYYRMAEVGLLAPDARVELIEGVVIDMAPIGSQHAGIVNYLTRFFTRAVADRAIVTVQQPIRLGEHSEPQPDVSLLKMRADLYRNSHPTSADVLLLVEVSDTTLRFDRGPKLALYAQHAIPEVWIIDIEAKLLHCMRKPNNGSYESVTTHDMTSRVSVTAIADVHVAVSEVFN